VHDPISGQSADYRFPLLSSISITLHPEDMASSMSPMASPPGQEACAYQFFRARNLNRKNALPQYLLIQGVFIFLMTAATAIAIRWREQQT